MVIVGDHAGKRGRAQPYTRCLTTLHNLYIVLYMNSAQVSKTFDLSDPATYERVFSEQEKGVYAAAYRVLGNPTQAQDVVQDVFLRIWKRPDRFDPSRGEIGAFLRLMARSRALDVWREGDAANRAGDRLKVAVAQEPDRLEARPEIECQAKDERSRVRGMIRSLPDAQREAVVLSYWGGLTAEEIARRSGVPVGTAKSRVRLGLNRLREECPVEELRAA